MLELLQALAGERLRLCKSAKADARRESLKGPIAAADLPPGAKSRSSRRFSLRRGENGCSAPRRASLRVMAAAAHMGARLRHRRSSEVEDEGGSPTRRSSRRSSEQTEDGGNSPKSRRKGSPSSATVHPEGSAQHSAADSKSFADDPSARYRTDPVTPFSQPKATGNGSALADVQQASAAVADDQSFRSEANHPDQSFRSESPGPAGD